MKTDTLQSIKHFIYKVTSPSGKFYIGRHTTSNIEDGYFGSGKWIRSIKDKSKFTREILEYCASFEDLLERETFYLNEFVGVEGCMNFNNNPVGFASGDLNPAKSLEERQKRSVRARENNPASNPDVALKISISNTGKASRPSGWKHDDETKKKMSSARDGLKFSQEGREKLSESRRRQYENGEKEIPTFIGLSHSDETKEMMRIKALNREKKECPHCGLVMNKSVYGRWHGDKCKKFSD